MANRFEVLREQIDRGEWIYQASAQAKGTTDRVIPKNQKHELSH